MVLCKPRPVCIHPFAILVIVVGCAIAVTSHNDMLIKAAGGGETAAET